MSFKHRAVFEEVVWSDVSELITNAIPELGNIINDLNIDKKYRAYRARYPFGSKIIHDGVLHLPNKDGVVVPVTHQTIPTQIRENLSYRSVPIGIFTHNHAEVGLLRANPYMDSSTFARIMC